MLLLLVSVFDAEVSVVAAAAASVVAVAVSTAAAASAEVVTFLLPPRPPRPPVLALPESASVLESPAAAVSEEGEEEDSVGDRV